ncbi:MAG: pantoate--beta-alanine ligase [Bacteroidota bacterium]|nr:pantoate--beta-alanine ligase [Bacteroidota bacterium]
MILFKSGAELAFHLQKKHASGSRIGFVPTMGALHDGHLSLVRQSRSQCSLTVSSIFINPTQFNDPRDFQKYPVTLEKDIYLLEKAGVGALFLPEVEDLYPGGLQDLEKYDLGRLETLLEGKYRPGHFQGVCQAVRRLLDRVRPDDLFMGQKDYQQCLVVRRLLDLMSSSTVLHTCPILREADGLAMSSRNMRLSESERKKAPLIYQSLVQIKTGWQEGRPAGSVLEQARDLMSSEGLRVDYVEIARSADLAPWHEGDEGMAVALVAASLGEVRLIDNMLL